MATNREKYEPIARQAAQKAGLDPDIFVRQINQESGFNPTARSGAGAYGIAQIMPQTAKGWRVDPADPVASLQAAAKNMAAYKQTYLKQGKSETEATRMALAAYNAGPGTVSKYKGVPPFRETQNYVRNIMGGKLPKATTSKSGQVSLPDIPQVPNIELAPQQRLEDLRPATEGGKFLQNFAIGGQAQLGDFLGVSPAQALTVPKIDIGDVTSGARELRQQAAQIPQAPSELPSPKQFFSDLMKEKPVEQPSQPQFGLGTEIVAGLVQPFTGNTLDTAAKELGGRPAYTASNIIGNLGATALGALGGVPGVVGTQAGLGATMELQRQRISNEPIDLLKAGGSALIQGGTAALPALKGATLLGTVGKNIARDAAVGAGGSVAQQLIEGRGVDLGRTAAETGLAATGGAVSGYMARPPAPLAPRLPVPQLGEIVPDATPVIPRTPSLRRTSRPINLDQPLEITTPVRPVNPTVAAPTIQPFAVPEQSLVKPVEYTTQPKPAPADGSPVPERAPKAPAGGVDAAFYDLADDPLNEAALNAAREALPGYGDEHINIIAQRVKQSYDALDGQDVIPSNMVERIIQPKPVEADIVQGMQPKPQTVDTVVAHSKMLRGDRAAMEAQGVEGTIFTSKDDYLALKARQKDLPTQTANRASNFEALTPDVVVQRLREQIAMIDSGELRGISPRLRQSMERSLARLESGQLTPKQFRKAQTDMVDNDLRIEKQNIIDQLNEVHPSLRDAWDLDYDPETGLGRQKTSALKTLEEVEDVLTDEQYNLAKSIEIVAENDGRIRLDVDTEQTGATSRVGEKELSPLGFFRTKDNYVAVMGYNENGHKVLYYITPKANELGQTSKINRVITTVNQPAFRGEYANIYKGIREFSIDDIMKRPPREDGIRTSELLERAAKAQELSSRADIMAANPRFAAQLRKFMDNPRAATVQQVKDMEELLKTDAKLLQKLCAILGKAS